MHSFLVHLSRNARHWTISHLEVFALYLFWILKRDSVIDVLKIRIFIAFAQSSQTEITAGLRGACSAALWEINQVFTMDFPCLRQVNIHLHLLMYCNNKLLRSQNTVVFRSWHNHMRICLIMWKKICTCWIWRYYAYFVLWMSLFSSCFVLCLWFSKWSISTPRCQLDHPRGR